MLPLPHCNGTCIGLDPSSAPVVELGLSSMHVVDMMGRLTDELGLDLSPTLVYECVTIDAIAHRLIQELALDKKPTAPNEPSIPAATPFVQTLAQSAEPKVVLCETLVGIVAELTRNDDIDAR